MAGNWIKGAIKHPGAFSAKAKAAGVSTAAYAKEHAGDSGKLGKQARLAETLIGMGHKRKKSAAEKMYPKK
jgi:hypothetical protein